MALKPSLVVVRENIYRAARAEAALKAGLSCAVVDLTVVQNKACEARTMLEQALKLTGQDRENALTRTRAALAAVAAAFDAVAAEIGQ